MKPQFLWSTCIHLDLSLGLKIAYTVTSKLNIARIKTKRLLVFSWKLSIHYIFSTKSQTSYVNLFFSWKPVVFLNYIGGIWLYNAIFKNIFFTCNGELHYLKTEFWLIIVYMLWIYDHRKHLEKKNDSVSVIFSSHIWQVIGKCLMKMLTFLLDSNF